MLSLGYPGRKLKDEEHPVIFEDPDVHGKGGPGLFFSSAEPENAYQNRVEAGHIGKICRIYLEDLFKRKFDLIMKGTIKKG